MEPPSKKAPSGKDDGVVLHFVSLSLPHAPECLPHCQRRHVQDYDCFYAQVFENREPALRCRPLGVRQKNILATCNYNARRLGVGKLMLLSEARRICPNLVVVDGEDLSPFRDTSKVLFNFLRSHSWNDKVERLGFDEVFMGASAAFMSHCPSRCRCSPVVPRRDGNCRLQFALLESQLTGQLLLPPVQQGPGARLCVRLDFFCRLCYRSGRSPALLR